MPAFIQSISLYLRAPAFARNVRHTLAAPLRSAKCATFRSSSRPCLPIMCAREGGDYGDVPDEEVQRAAWKNATAAVIDDYVKSGTNIMIGDGLPDLLHPLLQTLDIHMEVEGIPDVAFAATTSQNMQLLKERHLPTDLSVNFKASFDVYVAPVSAVDRHFNIVLDAADPSAEHAAMASAARLVFVMHEHALNQCEASGIRQLTVRVPAQLAQTCVAQLRAPSLAALGVADATLRGSDTVDLRLQPDCPVSPLYRELRTLPFVQAVALLPAHDSARAVLVVAPASAPTYDVTSAVAALSAMPKTNRRTALSDVALREALLSLDDWRVLDGRVQSLARRFVFATERQASRFVHAVQDACAAATHCAELRHSGVGVRVCVTTFDAGGISSLDVLVARYVSRCFDAEMAEMKEDTP